jgi:hypothetical protein
LQQPCLELLAEMGFRAEAALDLGPPGGLVMSYLGKCAPERRTAPDTGRRERDLLRDILAKPVRSAAAIADAVRRGGAFTLQIARADNLTSEDMDRLVAVHREAFPTFPYEFAGKLELMLGDTATYLMLVARSTLNGRIYAFSNLEINQVEIGDEFTLRLAEYDNTMRASHFDELEPIRGMGAAIRLALAQQAADHGLDLCHAESRACAAGINAVSHQIGMAYGGTLEHHLLISGQRQIEPASPTPYENMNTWYFNSQALDRMATGTDHVPLED